MSRFKLSAFIALITLAFAVALVGDALAGEKGKGRLVCHSVKWQQIEVGDVEGHIVAVSEAAGVFTVLEGDKFADGAAIRQVGLYDINTKSRTGTIHGYNEATSLDGAKAYEEWEGQYVPEGGAQGRFAWVRATGKWEGVKFWGTWKSTRISPTQWYSDSEWEVEK
jgi:hypothetical protein